MEFPAGWVDKTRDPYKVLGAPPPGDPDNCAILGLIVNRREGVPDETLDIYSRHRVAGYEKFPGYAALESGVGHLGNADARYQVYAINGGRRIAWVAYVNHRGYELVGEACDASFDRYFPIFQSVAETVRIEP